MTTSFVPPYHLTPDQRAAMEKAWDARKIPPDIPDSPWRVGAALKDEFEAGYLAGTAQARCSDIADRAIAERETLRDELAQARPNLDRERNALKSMLRESQSRVSELEEALRGIRRLNPERHDLTDAWDFCDQALSEP